jgi:hypothetical protein
MYNYYQPQSQYMGTQRQQFSYSLKGRPVTSIEEVRGMSIDFDGSVFYFPDLANNRIYTKQINLDGTASLNMYELKPIEPQVTTTDYVTRQEFEQAISKILNAQKDSKQQIASQF